MSDELGGVDTGPHPGQWRLDRIEVVNWGTFSGHHRIEVARKGFLLTGHSGSGKSSLVDAVAAVLTPRGKLHFNAAAADTSSRRQDRNVASYVRGAWRRQADESTGEVVSDFLRTGATWSGILLRYTDGLSTAPVTLVKLFHLRRGSNTSGDVSELHVLVQGDVGLLDFQPYARDGLETRRLKAAWPDATVTDKHSAFAARFSRLLGISGENALLLLHRTQSAKSLGNLDELFRNFMLDEPRTFDLAQTAVEQFGDLSRAHGLVVEARKQVEHLQAFAPHVAAYDQHQAAAAATTELRESLEPFRDAWKLGLAEAGHEAAEHTVSLAAADVTAAEQLRAEAEAAHAQALLLVQERGGQALEAQRLQVDRAQESARLVGRQHAELAESLRTVEVQMPASLAEFDELRTLARVESGDRARAQAEMENRLQALHLTQAEILQRERSLTQDLAALKGVRSNVDRHLLEARRRICAETGLSPAVLPFAGELLQVRTEHADWTGAVERVLRPLATVLLVPATHRDVVSRAVDATHLGTRLVYEVVPVRVDPPRSASGPASLIHRVEVKDSPMAAWLHWTLSRQYDYACVDSPAELHRHDRAVTLAGQVKRGGNRYEKDDRYAVDDRRRWVLGFDNADKVDHLLDLLRANQKEKAQSQARLGDAERRRRAEERRADVLAVLDRREWAELDVEAARARLDRAERALNELLAASHDLRAAELERGRAQDRLEEARGHEQRARRALAGAQAERDLLARMIAELSGREIPPVPAAHHRDLERRFHAVQRAITQDSIDRVGAAVDRALVAERDVAAAAAVVAERAITASAGAFRRAWPALAGDLTDQVSDRSGYLAILDRLASDRLPEFEERFFDLLTNQSQRNIGQLANVIRRAPGEIRDRVKPVNESLLRSEFDEGRHLQIQVRENRSSVVQEFLADLRQISSGSWDDGDRAAAEATFAVMDRLMARLASSESGDRNWQTLCLDTRRHVRFTGVELDTAGEIVNVHDSSAGLSGGQRQKLVVFCLAAALRYQLTPDDRDVPTYGSVILDEAFDKADSAFTRMAMDIFGEFGFHMILATPLKLLQTLEDYVGGIGLATCRDFRDSSVDLVAISDERLGGRGPDRTDRTTPVASGVAGG